METEIRTDLALEEKERFEGTDVEVSGVSLEKRKSLAGTFQVTMVKILDEHGASVMRKPRGTYVTLENCFIDECHPDLYEDMIHEISVQIRQMMKEFQRQDGRSKDKILIAGLGNRNATPDALGPVTVEDILIGKHLCAVAPGVMGQTGCETSDYIRGIVKEIQADLIIAVDALAARNTRRLNTTVQISDTGIHPGSGVGNHRQAITRESMGVPVIAIGVPTVVEAATIVNDVLDNLVQALEMSDNVKGLSQVMNEFSEMEKRQLVRELMDVQTRDLYVTPKDIDETIGILGKIISEGINDALAG